MNKAERLAKHYGCSVKDATDVIAALNKIESVASEDVSPADAARDELVAELRRRADDARRYDGNPEKFAPLLGRAADYIERTKET
jgi:copper chaperone CopZ